MQPAQKIPPRGHQEEGLAESGKQKRRKTLDFYDKKFFTLFRVHISSLFTTTHKVEELHEESNGSHEID